MRDGYDLYVKTYNEYLLIKEVYLNKKTSKNVPYINHIDEGLIILDKIDADISVQRAFCVHPIYQSDIMLREYYDRYDLDSNIMCLVMEYRNVANRCLSFHNSFPIISPLYEVNQMLIADKIQNYKDLLKYNRDRKNFKELEMYLQRWLLALSVSEEERDRLWGFI